MSHLRLVLLLGPALMVPAGTPMAVYADSTSLSGYSHIKIKASQVVKFIRGSAQATFNLKSTDKALKSWTCHSIRITAANILQAHMADSYIQTRLRWQSNTFIISPQLFLFCRPTHGSNEYLQYQLTRLIYPGWSTLS